MPLSDLSDEGEVGDEDLVVYGRAELSGTEVVHRVQVRDVRATLRARSKERHTVSDDRLSFLRVELARAASGLTLLGSGQLMPYS